MIVINENPIPYKTISYSFQLMISTDPLKFHSAKCQRICVFFEVVTHNACSRNSLIVRGQPRRDQTYKFCPKTGIKDGVGGDD